MTFNYKIHAGVILLLYFLSISLLLTASIPHFEINSRFLIFIATKFFFQYPPIIYIVWGISL